MQEIRIRASKVWGACFFGIAALNLYTYSLAHDGLQLALAIIMAVVGAMYMVSTLFVVGPGAVQLKNPLGMTLRTYPFDSPHDLRIDGRKLWVTMPDGRQKKLNGFMAATADWGALIRVVHDAQAGAEAAPPPVDPDTIPRAVARPRKTDD
jgi:hypothetical protein